MLIMTLLCHTGNLCLLRRKRLHNSAIQYGRVSIDGVYVSKLQAISRKNVGDRADGAMEAAKNKDSDSLGARLAYFRKFRALSLEQVATRAEITKSYLSKLERGLSSPTIATLLKLAKALNVNSEQLIGDPTQNTDVLVEKAKDRVPFSRSFERDGYIYEAIASHRTDKVMMPFIMYPPSTVDTKKGLASHAGEELILLISGKMEVIFSDRVIKLNAGDSVYFNASKPHRSRSTGKTPAKALVVVTDLSRRSVFEDS